MTDCWKDSFKNLKTMFEKYQHIERVGTDDVTGIEQGMCYVFPKIDGTNGQLWYDNVIQAGSRNRHLTLDNDNQGFYNAMINDQRIISLFEKHPDIKLYGEWLVPHTLRTYNDTAWNKFYVFDVMFLGAYLVYETYKIILDEFNIDYIPPICKIENPTYERLVSQLDKNTFLIKDGEGTGEGIVIKNYGYRNKYGRITWAKIVKNEFKTKHQKCDVTELKEKDITEQLIVNKYVTKELIEKEFHKIPEWSSKKIPQLLNVVFHCLVVEETWNFVKAFKNPTVDFGRLYYFTIEKIKKEMPNLF